MNSFNIYNSPVCTHPRCTGKNKTPIVRSRGWSYCETCFIKMFPQKAHERGLIEKDHPLLQAKLIIKINKAEKRKREEYNQIHQLSLFNNEEGSLS